MKEIKTQISINARPEKVWQALTDFENYPSWNPFVTAISGSKTVGEYLKVSVQPPDGSAMTFKPQVLAYKENEELRWKGKVLMKGIFDGEHYFMLKSEDNKTTNFVHGEKFSGFLVVLFGGMLDKTAIGFEKMNVALKNKCEEEQSKNHTA
ncbi:MAG: SRPBCC family protein [Chitinophagales bacterium]